MNGRDVARSAGEHDVRLFGWVPVIVGMAGIAACAAIGWGIWVALVRFVVACPA